MGKSRFLPLCLAILVWALKSPAAHSVAVSQIVEPNDNRVPAGRMDGSVLRVRLVAESGTWYPETEQNPGLPIQAFREEGGPLRVPGPLLRTPSGAMMSVFVRNAVPDTTLEVHGLLQRPAESEETLVVPFGKTKTVTFTAGAPGTYFYWATTSNRALNLIRDIDSQLSGAFVVDPLGEVEPDRIFVLGEWVDPEAPTEAAAERTAFVIKGLAWPHTERIHLRLGERARWRWVNPSFGGHPMHLHGSFYQILAKGDLLRETAYGEDERRSVVTERLTSGTTMLTEWTPEHEGNWLMHCHIVAHVSPLTRLGKPHAAATEHNHALEGMGGVVMGIEVARGGEEVGEGSHAAKETRRMIMFLEREEGHYGTEPGFGVALQEVGSPREPAAVPGPPLFLTRGQPVRIDLVNHLGKPTSVHWHGMELESYYDGVAGFSGTVTSVTPPVMPGERFEVRFTPPSAGTFIYHTHMDDARQLSAGLYGAMIIDDPNEPFDAEVDKIFIIGLLGSASPRPSASTGSGTTESP